MPSLLMGCGNSRTKKLYLEGHQDWTGDLITMDMDPNCGADYVHSLEDRPYDFPDDYFDEIHAYDVLEHIGRQGDWKGFFDEFAEYWRILKPNGLFGIVVPVGPDYHADPGHTRFFSLKWFGFLRQDFYQENLDAGTACTDYRWYWKKNFDICHWEDIGDHHLAVMLVKS